MDTRRVLTLAEAAEALRCSIPVLRRNIKEGKIPVIQMGIRKKVIPVAALERYLSNADNAT